MATASASSISLSLAPGFQQQPAAAGAAAPAEHKEAPAAATPFNRYVELTPYLYHGAWETVCKILSIMIIVAYIAAAVAGTIITGLLMPIYLPIAPVIAYTFLSYVSNGVSYFQGLAQEQAQKAYVENGIDEQLRTKVPERHDNIATFLEESMHIGFDWNTPASRGIADLARLRPLVARALFWENEAEKIIAGAETCEKAAKAITVNMETAANEPETTQDLAVKKQEHISGLSTLRLQQRLAALERQEYALTAKVMAAYFRGLITNPFVQQDHTELFSLQRRDVREQLMDKGLALTFAEHTDNGPTLAFGDSLVPPFLITAHAGMLSRAQVRGATIEQIRQAIFAPARAAPAVEGGAGDRKLELAIPAEPAAGDSKHAAEPATATTSDELP